MELLIPFSCVVLIALLVIFYQAWSRRGEGPQSDEPPHIHVEIAEPVHIAVNQAPVPPPPVVPDTFFGRPPWEADVAVAVQNHYSQMRAQSYLAASSSFIPYLALDRISP